MQFSARKAQIWLEVVTKLSLELRNGHLELKTLTFPYLDSLPSFLAVRSSTVEHRSNTSFCQVLEQGRCSNTLPRGCSDPGSQARALEPEWDTAAASTPPVPLGWRPAFPESIASGAAAAQTPATSLPG